MKILLFGSTGQLGWELQRALDPLGEVVAPDRSAVNLEDVNDLRAAIRDARPDVIVNAAAYTAVDQAEKDSERAQRVNCDAVDIMAAEAAVSGAWLVHYSTDYVFDGALSRPYREDDTPQPLSIYGRTKLAGEAAARARHARHLILRTSWLYGVWGGNFAKTMLRLAREREELRVVSDQHGAPTSTRLVADVTALILYRIRSGGGDEALAGTYHLAAAGETNWYDYARFVITQALERRLTLKTGPDRIHAIATEDYPLPAMRPRNSRLDTSKLATAFDVRFPDWRIGVARVVAELAKLENA